MAEKTAIERFKLLQQGFEPRQIFRSGTGELALEDAAKQVDFNQQQINQLQAIARATEQPEVGNRFSGEQLVEGGQSFEVPTGQQGSILPVSDAKMTQAFGNRSSVESFSGGVNLGTDWAVKEGTPLALPPGEWVVESVFQGAKPGNRNANFGSGNMVRVRNSKTGETLAFEHLKGVAVQSGQVLNGGTIIGTSGNTGNSTGPHVSIPYKNPQGQYQDVRTSPYGRFLFSR